MHSDIQSFWHQSELSVYIDDPFNKKSTRCVFNFGWYLDSRKIIRLELLPNLLSAQISENLTDKFRNLLGITQLKLVGKSHLFAYLLSVDLQTFPEGH